MDTPRGSDPVTLEIVRNALASIADEMALVILRSAFSPIVRDSMDYSTALCDRMGRVVAQGLTNPIHLGSFPTVMAHVVARYGADARPGDGYLVNDPYGFGGMHLPDIYLIRPIVIDDAVEGFSATLVHHADVGGMAPGSMALQATDLFQEGLRLPLLKLFDGGRPNEAVMDILAANSRVPDQLMGDLRAQIAAGVAAERGLVDLIRRYGAERLRAMMEDLHDYAERLIRGRIAAMPDGIYEAEDYIDGLGETGEPIRFRVAVTVAGENIAVDWAGTSPQVKGAINGPIATTLSMAYAALRCAVGPGIPNCEGYMRAVTVTAPLGSIVNPTAPAACAARGVLAYRMLDTLFAAFAQIVPGAIPAGGEGGPSVVSLSGRGADGAWLVTDGIFGAWGGRAQKDGVDGVANPGANLSNQPIELIEARVPLRIESYGLVPNSGGAGRHRGGLAVHRAYRLLDEHADLTLRSDRRRMRPRGVDGGHEGSPSLSVVGREGGASLLPVMPMHTIGLTRGDVVTHVTAGGGGAGDPCLRDPSAVAEDVLDGKVTRDYARDVYGVVLTEAGHPDATATEAARRTLRANPAATACAATAAFFAADPRLAPFAAEVAAGKGLL